MTSDCPDPRVREARADLLDELLALDLLTLREHTERAGDRIDPIAHRAGLDHALDAASRCEVRRDGRLVAYAMCRPDGDERAFVTAFSTHPAHRDAGVLRELMAAFAAMLARGGVRTLRSHVYQTNRLSLAFHRRLGFRVTRENARAVEFEADVDALRWPGARRGAA